MAKTLWSFGPPECKRVKQYDIDMHRLNVKQILAKTLGIEQFVPVNHVITKCLGKWVHILRLSFLAHLYKSTDLLLSLGCRCGQEGKH